MRARKSRAVSATGLLVLVVAVLVGATACARPQRAWSTTVPYGSAPEGKATRTLTLADDGTAVLVTKDMRGILLSERKATWETTESGTMIRVEAHGEKLDMAIVGDALQSGGSTWLPARVIGSSP